MRELLGKKKRGLTDNLTSDLGVIVVYRADISNDEYSNNLSAKGQELIIGLNIKTKKDRINDKRRKKVTRNNCL